MKQHVNGSALIVSLIILLVMTIIGIQGMQSSIIEEKMAGNFQDRTLAFQAAEAALKHAEARMVTLDTRPALVPASTTGLELEVWAFASRDFSDASLWNDAPSVPTTIIDEAWNVAEAPQFIVEQRESVGGSFGKDAETGSISDNNLDGDTYNYRITVRGVGKSSNSVVYLQSNYSKIYGN